MDASHSGRFAQSIEIWDYSYTRTENCNSKCLPIDNSKFNFKSITFRTRSILHFIFKNKQFLTLFKKNFVFRKTEEITGRLLIIPEEHNFALKFKDDHPPDDHANLLKGYKSDSKLLTSPILPENHCSKKLQLITTEDKVIWDLIETMKTNRPMVIHGSYMKNFAKDLHVKDDLLFLDSKLVVPATIRGISILCYTRPSQAS